MTSCIRDVFKMASLASRQLGILHNSLYFLLYISLVKYLIHYEANYIETLHQRISSVVTWTLQCCLPVAIS